MDEFTDDRPQYDHPGIDIIRRWFNSHEWSAICESVEDDDDASCKELMTQVNDQLCSLVFHLNNDPGSDRVDYELEYFKQLCDDFNIA